MNLRAAILACALLFSVPATAAETAVVTLGEAVSQAQARQPTALAAAQEIARMNAVLEQVRAGALPTLQGTASYTRLDHDRVLGARVTAAADQLYASVSLVVPLVSPQRWVMWTHAEDQVAVAKAGAAEVRWQVGVAAARAWLAALAQTRVIEALTQARETALQHAQFARDRRRGGVGNQLDIVRAEQELATTEGQLRGSEAALIRLREQLGVLMGAEGAVTPAQEAALPEPATVQGDPDRPDVRTTRERQRASARVVRDSYADWLPTLSASLAPFAQAPAIAPQPTWGYQAQLLLTVPIFDVGLRQGQRREREALQAQADLQVEAVLRQARSEVRAAWQTIRQADAAVQVARQAEALAVQALDLSRQAWKAGITTNLEVVDAERRSRDAATARVVAEDIARQARLDLLVATGAFP